MVDAEDRRTLKKVEELINGLMDKHWDDLSMPAHTAFSEGLREIRLGFKYMEASNGGS